MMKAVLSNCHRHTAFSVGLLFFFIIPMLHFAVCVCLIRTFFFFFAKKIFFFLAKNIFLKVRDKAQPEEL